MIELPIWVFILMCILSAPIALVVVFVTFVLLITPFFALRCASQADKAMEIKEGMRNTNTEE